ncbi:MAG TPA: alpha/beta hydrolase [Mycobacteriales bacterium]|nr:alpha/beta hydrolase [Mycobacteriales bacterium]
MGIATEARGRVRGDGIRLGYGFWPGSGRPIVGIHGITASYLNFVGIAERLAGRRGLLALDLRGRGDADKPAGPYGMRQHARDVAAAMTAFDLGGSILVGHSMGAYVAVALAAEFPELVAGLVLIDGGPPLDPPPGIDVDDLLEALLSAQVGRLSQTFGSLEEYYQFWRELPTFRGGRWGPWVEAYLGYDLGGEAPRLQPKASAAAVRADSLDAMDTAVLRRRLAGLAVPVLLLRAAEGMAPGQPPLMTDDVVDECAGLVSAFEHRVVPGTTHYTIALGDPGASVVADAVVEFAESCGR